MAAAVESIQTIPVMLGNKIAYAYKLKFWSKNQALDMAMRHAGLFESDNRQRRENLKVQINIVGAPTQPKTIGNAVAGTNAKNGSHP